MKYLFLLIIVFPFYLHSQTNEFSSFSTQSDLIEKAKKESDQKGKFDPIEELIKSNQITIKEQYQSLIITATERFSYLYDNRYASFWGDTLLLRKFADSVLKKMDTIYNISPCESKARVKYAQYNFLKTLLNEYGDLLNKDLTRLYNESLTYIEDKGFIPEKDGIAIAIIGSAGKSNWIGTEFSFVSHKFEIIKFKYSCEGKEGKYKDGGLYFGSAFTIGYSRNLNTSVNDFSFSLIDMYTIIAITPTKFGYQFGGDLPKASFYYRPGIGLCYKNISLMYSYNFEFSKITRSVAEKSILTLKLYFNISTTK